MSIFGSGVILYPADVSMFSSGMIMYPADVSMFSSGMIMYPAGVSMYSSGMIMGSSGEVATSPPLNRKVGGSRPAMIRARCLRVKKHYPAQKNNQKICM